MQREENNTADMITIDLVHIWKKLKKKLWVIVLTAILTAAMGFSMAAFVETPQYSSSILLYVNNSSINLGSTSFNITASDISASMSLVKTYGVVLTSRTTLERIIEKTGVPYSVGALRGMISTSSEQQTEIMRVTVVSTDPYEAAKIANCIAEVLPARTAEIIDGATMEVVDAAVPNLGQISPSVTQYTFLGMMVGVLLSAGIIVLLAVLDNTINDDEYVLKTYDYPLLAKIPDLLKPEVKGSGYYMQNYAVSQKKK